MSFHGYTETSTHILRDCFVARVFWNKLGIPQNYLQSFRLPLMEWIQVNCKSNAIFHKMQLPWFLVFSMGLWTLWLRRNFKIFQPQRPTPDPVSTCLNKATEFFFPNLSLIQANPNLDLTSNET